MIELYVMYRCDGGGCEGVYKTSTFESVINTEQRRFGLPPGWSGITNEDRTKIYCPECVTYKPNSIPWSLPSNKGY